MIRLKESFRVGFSFGLTSGIITTLGLMVGLTFGTGSKVAVLGGILTIAIADAFSDALGIHISEESENVHSAREVWESTISTFVFKFLVALTFIVPVLVFPLRSAAIVSIFWGLGLLSVLSYRMGLQQKEGPLMVVAEHLVIAIVVVVLTYLAGEWISGFFMEVMPS